MTAWTGAVLIGGESRRMGRDKALIDVGGTTLPAIVAGRLRDAGADEVLAVGGVDDRVDAAPSGTRWVPDGWPGRGPVGGVASAMGAARTEVVAVVACDLPALDVSTLGRLADSVSGDESVDVAVARSRHGRQPLVAAWAVRLRPILETALDAGASPSVHAVLAGLVVTEVEVEEDEVVNLNRPEDLAAFLSAHPTIGTLPAAPPSRRSLMDVPEIDVETLTGELAAGRPLVDVREPDEYAKARVPGGILIPIATVPERIDEIPSDGAVYVVCRSGGRSAQAVAFLRERGVDAVNVAGGTNAWIEAGREVDRG